MNSIRVSIFLLPVLLLCAFGAQAQRASAQASTQTAAVPHLVKVFGSVKDASGKALTGIVGITFALYKDDQGGAPLWIEAQSVPLEAGGHYSVMLGSTKPDGLPTDLFTEGEARWLGVQPEGVAEQPRVLLLSVPYALKAGDAATLGGLPPSAFVQAANPSGPASAHATASASAPAAPTVQGSGTLNFLPIWTGTTTIGSSTMFEKGGKLGLGTTTPATTLDVKGAATIRGNTAITGTLNIAGGLSGQTGNFTATTNFLGTSVLSVVQKGTSTGLYASAVSGAGVDGVSSTGTGVFAEGRIGVTAVGTSYGGVFISNGLILQGTNEAGQVQLSEDALGNLSTAGRISAGAGATIGGNGLQTLIGDPGCGGSGTTAVGFSNSGLSNCSNYAVRGDTGGNLYINSNSTGWMFFDHNNNGTMALDPSGNLSVNGQVSAHGGGTSGFGISVDNNASQARAASGFVKAMAYVDPFASGGIAITRCYNSQMTGAASTTPPCGIAVVHQTLGTNLLDFGFQVSDRFVTLTAANTPGNGNTVGAQTCDAKTCAFVSTVNQIGIQTFYTPGQLGGNYPNWTDTPFYILVF
jgi:hypothetical protein